MVTANSYDFDYSLMGGDLNLMYSMNSDFDENDEMTMMDYLTMYSRTCHFHTQ